MIICPCVIFILSSLSFFLYNDNLCIRTQARNIIRAENDYLSCVIRKYTFRNTCRLFFFFYHDNLCFRTQAKNITKNKFYIKKMNFETVKKA